MSKIIRVAYAEMKKKTKEILLSNGCSEDDSELIAKVISDSTCDGFQSHGINRFPLLVKYIKEDHVKTNEDITLVNSFGSIKQFDGNLGLGIKNAYKCTKEAIRLAKKNSLSIITLRNTNHWLRAGTYGWLAADKRCILICWTNTTPNLPPHGSSINLVGNNPIMISIPRKNREHIVLDMSMSQYSYGKVASYARQDKQLPTVGGYDEKGNLTDSAKEIREKGRHLPIGFWKGSALSLVLDILAASLSGGLTTVGIDKFGGVDKGMSQVFIAINPDSFGDQEFQEKLVEEILSKFKLYNKEENCDIKYPGQMTLIRRRDSQKNGIPVEKEIWDKVLEMAK